MKKIYIITYEYEYGTDTFYVEAESGFRAGRMFYKYQDSFDYYLHERIRTKNNKIRRHKTIEGISSLDNEYIYTEEVINERIAYRKEQDKTKKEIL